MGFLRRLFGEGGLGDGRGDAAPTTPLAADPIAEATLLALHHQHVRPTPEAYTIWYRHLGGERPDLSRRLKDLESRGEPFDAPLIAELFERYFGSADAVGQVTRASRAIEGLLADLAHDLGAVEADARRGGDRLDELGAALARSDDGPTAVRQEPARAALRAMLATILGETAAMRAAAVRLHRRAIESAGEIAQLRATIEAAGLGLDHDPVTGVASQRALRRALRRALTAPDARPAAADANPRPSADAACYLVVDLDDFRRFNEAHGRRLGDLVMKAVARQLKGLLAPGDTIGRLDGAAFGIVRVATDLTGGEALAERLCHNIAELRLEPADAALGRHFTVPPVTAAIGVAAYHPGEPLERLAGRADRARQVARQAGGNRMVSERTTTVVGRPKA